VIKLRIGVLALQGDVIEHINILKLLKVNTKEVRKPTDLDYLDGLIIPGGESTTISKLLKQTKLDRAIKIKNKKGMAVFGTCAGAIIVSQKVLQDKVVTPLNLIELTIQRNAYGRQSDSFETKLKLNGKVKLFDAVFIRAPIIKSIGKKVKVISTFQKKPVLVLQKNVLVSTFHTELKQTRSIHQLFLEQIKENLKN